MADADKPASDIDRAPSHFWRSGASEYECAVIERLDLILAELRTQRRISEGVYAPLTTIAADTELLAASTKGLDARIGAAIKSAVASADLKEEVRDLVRSGRSGPSP